MDFVPDLAFFDALKLIEDNFSKAEAILERASALAPAEAATLAALRADRNVLYDRLLPPVNPADVPSSPLMNPALRRVAAAACTGSSPRRAPPLSPSVCGVLPPTPKCDFIQSPNHAPGGLAHRLDVLHDMLTSLRMETDGLAATGGDVELLAGRIQELELEIAETSEKAAVEERLYHDQAMGISLAPPAAQGVATPVAMSSGHHQITPPVLSPGGWNREAAVPVVPNF